MTIEGWIRLWGIVLVATTGIFACLTVVVAIGGIFDIRALFRNIEAKHKQESSETTEE